MYRPITVANRLLALAAETDKALTPLQLVKLLYVAHGFSLALLNRPLIAETIQAWKYGPVVKSIYHKVKQYGRGPITEPIANNAPVQNLDADALALTEALMKRWGHLSGVALSNWTHKPGSPWHQVFRDDAADLEIPDELIQEYFRAFVLKRREAIAEADNGRHSVA